VTVAAIIVAGGSGERFGRPEGKQLAVVAGAPVLTHAIRAFEQAAAVDDTVVVVHPERLVEYRSVAVDPFGFSKVRGIVGGGETRQASVEAGVGAVPDSTTVVAVHDGARPLVTADTIDAAVARLLDEPRLDGVVVGHPMYDTVKEVESGGRIVGTPDRDRLWAAQTPQVFRLRTLSDALDRARAAGRDGTDDAALVAEAGGRVIVVEGPRENVKVTVEEDLAVVAAVLGERTRQG
jgi:2-C-methyl-D-erythritol 4-phosphate cytidylyltransferase